MNKILILLLIVALVLSITVMGIGCKEEAVEEETVEEAPAEEVVEEEITEEKLDIAFTVMSMDQPYFVAIYEHMKKIAEAENFNLTLYDPHFKVEELQDIIDTIISTKPDGVLFAPVEFEVAPTMVQDMLDAGLTVISYNDNVRNTFSVVLDNYGTGKLAGTESAKYWKEHFPDVEPKVGLLDVPWVPLAMARIEGFIEGFSLLYPGFQPTSRLNLPQGVGIVEGSMAKFEDMLEANPEINLIYAWSDNGTQTGVAVLEAKGKGTSDKALAVGFDGSEAAIIALKDPNSAWKVEVGNPPKEMAYTTWDVFKKVREGESVPIESKVLGKVITPDMADQWLADQFFLGALAE